MRKPIFLVLMGLALAVVPLQNGTELAYGNGGPVTPAGGTPITTYFANSPLGVIPAGTKFGVGNNTGTAMRKFVDSLPGLSVDGGVTGANNLGQYIPVATPATLNGDDYYVFGLRDYQDTDAYGPAPSQAPNSGAITRSTARIIIRAIWDPWSSPACTILNTRKAAPLPRPREVGSTASRPASGSKTILLRAPRATSSSRWTLP